MQHNDFSGSFLWGVATSAYQIEGAVHEDGRGESIWDRFSHTPGKIADGSNGDVACNHYHLYEDDIKLLLQLGVQAYRFSIAWPRVLPQGRGEVNPAGLDFYERLVDKLLAAGIVPHVTLNHWDLPQVLEDYGGWTSRETVLAFVDYADVVVRRLGDRVHYWATHNEPWVIAFLGYHQGIFAPGISDLKSALQAVHHLLLSHGMAVPVIREAAGLLAQVGIVLNLCPAYPATSHAADIAAAQRFDGFFNRWFLNPLAGRGYPEDMLEYYKASAPRIMVDDMRAIAAPIDFLGVNYYNRINAADNPGSEVPSVRDVPDPSHPRTADREVYPEGLYDLLARIHEEYSFPALYITENGAAFNDHVASDGRVHDNDRITFLKEHIAQAERAIQAGIPLRGYFIWSLMDNFEWASGFSLRYGLVYVDYKTQQRIIKDSGLWLRNFILAKSLQFTETDFTR